MITLDQIKKIAADVKLLGAPTDNQGGVFWGCSTDVLESFAKAIYSLGETDGKVNENERCAVVSQSVRLDSADRLSAGEAHIMDMMALVTARQIRALN